jgi:hypothetical protein
MLLHELQLNDDTLSHHRQLLHTVEHAFDNQRIESALKHPLSKAYVAIFTLFNPDNYERLISKTKYYFNIKEDGLALDIL